MSVAERVWEIGVHRIATTYSSSTHITCLMRNLPKFHPSSVGSHVSVLLIAGAVLLSGCASGPMRVNDPVIKASEERNDRIADVWQQAGNPQTARIFRQKADQDREAQKKSSYGFLDVVVDALFDGWLRSMPGSTGRR